ncbi:Uracil-DNA glycosylase [Spathaspora sp. JA1]|nr:Uracil-DNA glycosylase [Spathaspora sp. JA1]
MSKRVLITDFFNNKGGVNNVKKKKVVKTETKMNFTTSSNKENIVKEVIKVEEKVQQQEEITVAPSYEDICQQYNFNKVAWIKSLSSEQQELLNLEINTLHISWLAPLHQELTKPYFLKLKQFLKSQSNGKTIFPPTNQIYSWSHYTPLPDIKCLILGQDPYHNINQAHGLAFSVLEPTRPPPSLVNIYKTLAIDFPEFKIPKTEGNLSKWAERGVLLLNACLTVEAHKANSHANQGWETFTEQVIRVAIEHHIKQNQGFVIMAWGNPAQKRVIKFNSQLLKHPNDFLVLKTVHPSPLSAHRGFFTSKVFKQCNQWLQEHNLKGIDWGLTEDNIVV